MVSITAEKHTPFPFWVSHLPHSIFPTKQGTKRGLSPAPFKLTFPSLILVDPLNHSILHKKKNGPIYNSDRYLTGISKQKFKGTSVKF